MKNYDFKKIKSKIGMKFGFTDSHLRIVGRNYYFCLVNNDSA